MIEIVFLGTGSANASRNLSGVALIRQGEIFLAHFSGTLAPAGGQGMEKEARVVFPHTIAARDSARFTIQPRNSNE